MRSNACASRWRRPSAADRAARGAAGVARRRVNRIAPRGRWFDVLGTTPTGRFRFAFCAASHGCPAYVEPAPPCDPHTAGTGRADGPTRWPRPAADVKSPVVFCVGVPTQNTTGCLTHQDKTQRREIGDAEGRGHQRSARGQPARASGRAWLRARHVASRAWEPHIAGAVVLRQRGAMTGLGTGRRPVRRLFRSRTFDARPPPMAPDRKVPRLVPTSRGHPFPPRSGSMGGATSSEGPAPGNALRLDNQQSPGIR
jgi:hypothetical protein